MSVKGYTPEFGERLRYAIEQIGNLSKAADVAGITYEQLARWRDGKAKPNLFAILAIAEAANIDLRWLATGEGSPDGTPTQQPAQPAAAEPRAERTPIEITIIINERPGLLRRLFGRGRTQSHTIKFPTSKEQGS